MSIPPLPPKLRVIERDWLSANQVVFIDADTTAVVDTGYVKHRELTVSLIDRVLAGRPLERILNTHLHSDHCGGNAALQHRWPQARTAIPVASAQAVAAWDEDRLSYRLTGQRCDRFVFDSTLSDGQTVELGRMRWQVLAAPGHDPDSIILYCPDEGILISADALWQDGFGVTFPELVGASGFSEQKAILERIQGLTIERVIPGHGPVFTEVHAALDRAHERLSFLAADPVRHARYAIKVLVKFLLLDRESIELSSLAALLEAIPLVRATNARLLGLSPTALADWVVEALVRAGAARLAGGQLVNA